MNFKIVSDSSSNILGGEDPCFASVPMKIIAQQEYVDAPGLDVAQMVADLKGHKGKSGSSCPNVGEWLEAFGDAPVVYSTTISGALSGSYSAACHAAETYTEEYPDRKVIILDSMTTGPEEAMLHDKLRQLAESGLSPEQVREAAVDYHAHTHTLFCLESLTNLARNGRVNPAVAKLAGVLGIRLCGEAKEGQIAPIHKARGLKKATQVLLDMIRERGFQDGNLLRIAHCFALEQAQALKEAVLAEYPSSRIVIEPTTALCSFYAENGGLIIGLEGSFNAHNHMKP